MHRALPAQTACSTSMAFDDLRAGLFMELLADNALHDNPMPAFSKLSPFVTLTCRVCLASRTRRVAGQGAWPAFMLAMLPRGRECSAFSTRLVGILATCGLERMGGGSGGLRSVLEKLDVDGNSFEAVMMDLHSYLLDRDVTEVYTLRDSATGWRPYVPSRVMNGSGWTKTRG